MRLSTCMFSSARSAAKTTSDSHGNLHLCVERSMQLIDRNDSTVLDIRDRVSELVSSERELCAPPIEFGRVPKATNVFSGHAYRCAFKSWGFQGRAWIPKFVEQRE